MADIAPLFEEYKQRFSTYGIVLTDKANAIKNQALELQPKLVEISQVNFEKVKNALLDLTPIGNATAQLTYLLDQYAWVAVCLFIGSIGYFIGNTLAALILGLVFNTGLALNLAVFIIPLAAYIVCLKTEVKDERCLIVLAATVSSSILIGYVLSARYLSITPPPMFLFPAVLGFGAAIVGPAMGDKERPQFVGALIGIAAAVAFVLGLITGNLGMLYIIWVALLSGVAFLDFQLQIMCNNDGNHGLSTNQMCSIAVYQLAGFIITMLFSSSSPSQPASEPASVAAAGGR